MATEQQRHPAPFIGAAHRHDILTQLARTRVRAFDQTVSAVIAKALEATPETKLDGKNGSIDGVASVSGIVGDGFGIAGFPAPNFPPTGKEGKEDKEGKEGKESKDSKEGKDSKESKDGKEGKDTSDSGKAGGSEVQDPFYLYGDVEILNWLAMNQIARIQGTQVSTFIKSVQVI
jgi:hypothetical protein